MPALKDWLMPVERDNSKALCKFCKCELLAKLSDLKKHVNSQKHIKSSQPFSSARQTKLDASQYVSTQKLATSEAEGWLSMAIAEHTAFLAADHLSEGCKKVFNDSHAAKNMKLHRTKCRNIVVNILAPHFVESLQQDIGGARYSILIDESTDISVVKLLGVVVRYFSKQLQKIVCTYLGLVELEDGTASSIVSAIIKMLENVKLDPKKLIGVGVDNAAVNTGINKGVCELLKEQLELPHLIMVRCVCHSIQLAVSHAVGETLPRNIDHMVRETYNWFGHSSKRQMLYKTLYETLNDGKCPLQIPRVCDTRWISLEPAVTRILSQWEELRMHFNITRSSEKCYSAEMLFNMYSDPINKLYMLFLRPLLQDIQRTMKAFQGENTDPTKLLSDLSNLVASVSNKVLIPTARVNPLTSDISPYIDSRAYLGYEFERMCSTSKLLEEQERNLRERCIACVTSLCSELRNRLPENVKILKKMSLFAVDQCLRVVKEEVTEIAEVFGCIPEQIERIDNQWRNLTVVKWHETSSTVKFWIEVYSYKDASGINPYFDLCELAISVLSLPHSNAEVERLFSQMNIVKSKLRNRLNISSVNAVLAVRSGLRRLEKTCNTYDLPIEIIKQIGTMATYGSKATEAGPSTSGTSVSEETDEEEDHLVFALH